MNLNCYIDLLSIIKDHGYTFETFQHQKSYGTVILRHDIDFCPKAAYEMAKMESSQGFFSTYFFMLSSNTYNLSSELNQSLVKAIKDFGHQISLHFDPSIYKDLDSNFLKEKRFFEDLFEEKIKITSLHRPGAFLENNNRKLPDIHHTYEDAFFKNMVYISDSGGKDIKSKIQNELSNMKNLHILIHPVWWIYNGNSPSEKLETWLRKNSDFLIQETAKNCKSFNIKRAA